jgi:hypothetical protein
MIEDPEAVLDQFFQEETNVSSGLEGVLRESGEEEITDLHIFETYRAIGCQSFDMWSTSVHRIVMGACAEVETLAAAVASHSEGLHNSQQA